MTTNTDAVPSSLPDDLNPEIVKATAAFIGQITGLVPPPHDAFPPKWYGYLRTFTARVKEIAGENAAPGGQRTDLSSEDASLIERLQLLASGDGVLIKSEFANTTISRAIQRLAAVRPSTPATQADHIADDRKLVAQVEAVPSELHEAARQFHNLTLGDPSVIIRAPSAKKRDAIIVSGDRLRAALSIPHASLQDCSANPADCPNNEGYGCECAAASAGDQEVGS